MTPRHSLSQRDPEARTAVCSICGPVGIYRAGRGFVCANKQREMNRRWAERNPGNAAASRQKPGAHRLLADGVCVICGPVDVVPWGRGWTCGNRARELRTNQQATPVQRCPDCKRWLSSEFPIFDGRCEACRDLATPGRSLSGLMAYGRDPELVALDVSVALDHDLSMARWYSLNKPDDGKDRTRPGLKTLGDRNVPEEWAWALKRNPEWWRLDQMGSPAEGGTRTEGGSVMHYGLSSGITGHSVTETPAPQTLPDLYPKYRDKHESFPDFKARFLAGSDISSPPDAETLRNLLDYHEDDDYYTIDD